MTAGDAQAGYTDQRSFEALVDAVLSRESRVDRVSLYLRAETSDFLRFNRSALRQATTVEQAFVTIAVERGQRRSESTLSLAGTLALDTALLRTERDELIAQLDLIPDDPWLQIPTTVTRSHRDDRGRLPDAGHLIALIHETAGAALKQDLAGFHAGGPVVHAFADSHGSRHWHRVESFHFDWCLHHRADRAVKTAYAGTQWDDAVFAARLEEASRRLSLFHRAARPLQTGPCRAALSPAAMVDLLSAVGWGGFSLKARRTGVSPLMRLERGEALLHPGFDLAESVAEGIAPAFTAEGFVRPPIVPLIVAGRCPPAGGTLNSPRSAIEYGVGTNGANSGESPEAMRLAAGSIAEADLLRALDTGLYVSNLWYLNYSDRQACRVTGMTRYACFWVEGGQPVAPVDVMRFDVDVLRLFGDGLVGLTDRSEFIPGSSTYGARQLSSVTTPAALVDGFTLTL